MSQGDFSRNKATAFLARIDWNEGCFQVEPCERARVILGVDEAFVVPGAKNHVTVAAASGMQLLCVEQTHFSPRLFGEGTVRVLWAESDDETVNQLIFGLVYVMQKGLRLGTSTLDDKIPFVIGAPELQVERVTETIVSPQHQ
jgi:hypothetical protein